MPKVSFSFSRFIFGHFERSEDFFIKNLYFEDELDVKYPFLIVYLGSETDLVI